MTSNLGAVDGAEVRETLTAIRDRDGVPALRAYVSEMLGLPLEAEAEAEGEVVEAELVDDGEAAGSAGAVAPTKPGDELIARAVADTYMKSVRKHLTPEFINRIDDIVTFNPLSPAAIRAIVGLEASKVADICAERRVGLALAPSAVDYVARKAYDERWGGRLVKRVLSREVTVKLAKAMVEEGVREGDHVTVCTAAAAPAVRAQVEAEAEAAQEALRATRSDAHREQRLEEARIIDIVEGNPAAEAPEAEERVGVAVLGRQQLGCAEGEELVFVVNKGAHARKVHASVEEEDASEEEY
jgi:uncharacterized protein YdaT